MIFGIPVAESKIGLWSIGMMVFRAGGFQPGALCGRKREPARLDLPSAIAQKARET